MKISTCLVLCVMLPAVVWSMDPDSFEAARRFEQCSQGHFVPFSKADPISGPSVPMDGGTKVHSAVLRYQGEIIAKEGVKAFDVAFHYLNDDRVHMRWIAVDVLGRITGKRPLWYLYGKPGQVFQGDPDWSDRAKKEWTKWKTEQPGGDQPATKPVDKPPAKDQPLTPTSKDIAR